MEEFNKAYMGDAVYVEIRHGKLVLTAENGIEAHDTIYLEPEVMDNLIRYFNRAVSAAETARMKSAVDKFAEKETP